MNEKFFIISKVIGTYFILCLFYLGLRAFGNIKFNGIGMIIARFYYAFCLLSIFFVLIIAGLDKNRKRRYSLKTFLLPFILLLVTILIFELFLIK